MIGKLASKKLCAYFLEQQETISIAESVTSGLLQWQFSNLPDASKYYQGGITVYNVGQKYRHLFVEPIHALSCNCVSAKVAEEMALNVCALFHSNWGIGITGYATPVPRSAGKLFCYYSLCYNGSIRKAGKIVGKKMSPENVQKLFAKDVVSSLLSCIDTFDR